MTADMIDIFQLHWQKHGVGNEHITEFVCQGSLVELEAKGKDPLAWIARRIEDERHTCPRGWFPLVIYGDHPRMMLTREVEQ